MLVLTLIFCLCLTTHAESNINEKVKDQVDMDGGFYVDYQKLFESKGLTYEIVKSLQNQGFSYNQILSMETQKILSLVPASQRASLLAAPSGFVRVTNVGGTGETAYFHSNTGMVAGNFYNNNDGTWIQNRVKNFSNYVYNKSGISCMYYLWGEWDDNAYTHQGVDFQDTASNPPIYFPLTGVVVTVGATGRVGIYNEQNEVTYFFAHMTNRTVSVGQRVNADTIIGYEGNVGANSTHLHFEVRSGRQTTMGVPDNGLHTLNPYNYMNHTIDPDRQG